MFLKIHGLPPNGTANELRTNRHSEGERARRMRKAVFLSCFRASGIKGQSEHCSLEGTKRGRNETGKWGNCVHQIQVTTSVHHKDSVILACWTF